MGPSRSDFLPPPSAEFLRSPPPPISSPTHHFSRQFLVAAGKPPSNFFLGIGERPKINPPTCNMLVVINHCLTTLPHRQLQPHAECLLV